MSLPIPAIALNVYSNTLRARVAALYNLPTESLTLMSRPYVAPTVVPAVPVGGQVIDTGSDFVYAKGKQGQDRLRIAVNYIDDDNYIFIESANGDGGFLPFVRQDGVDHDLHFVGIAGGVPDGHTTMIRRDDKAVTFWYSKPEAPNDFILFKTRTFDTFGLKTLSSKVKFFYGRGTSGEAGAEGKVLSLGTPVYDAFERTVTISGYYTDVAPGQVPNFAEIRYNGTGAWRPMANVGNSRAGVMEIADAGIPPSLDGAATAEVRWNNHPSEVVNIAFQITTPFAKMLGVNGGGLSTDISSEWEFLNSHQALVAPYPQNPNDGGGNQFANWMEYPGINEKIPASADGLNGTIHRDQANGFGRNSLGIHTYALRGTFVLGVPVKAYIQWPIGVTLRPRYGIPNFAHDPATGRMTFDTVVGMNYVDLLIDVNSIPAGQLCHPVVRDVAAPAQSPLIPIVKSVANGLRFLDAGQHNNPDNNTRTITAMPVQTLATRRTDGSQTFEGQAADLRATQARFGYGIFNHIDSDDYVAAFADHWANNLPNIERVFFGGGNEYFNLIFHQFGDGIIMGLRAGYGPENATVQTAVPEVIMDGQAAGIPAIVAMTDANGGNTSDQFVKTLRPFKAGDKFYKNIGGGVFCYEFLQDVPAGFIYAKGLNDPIPEVRIKYGSERCMLASKRIQADIIVRQGNIARQRFALAGKPKPYIVLEGQSGGIGGALESLNWNDSYKQIDYVSYAPYYNNNGQGEGGWMDWRDESIWTPAAKAKIIAGDYAGALALAFPGMLKNMDKQIATAHQPSIELRAYCVSKGLNPDAIKMIAYEFGDHNGFSGYNWPQGADAAAFMQFFWKDECSYILFKKYLVGLGSVGAPMFFYSFGPRGRPFGLVNNSADTEITGPNANYFYRAFLEIQAHPAMQGELAA